MGKKRTPPHVQEAHISSFAEAHNWQLQGIHEDMSWASDGLNRPGLVALIANSDFDILIVDRADRLAPNKSRSTSCSPSSRSRASPASPRPVHGPLAEHVRHWYRDKGNPIYAQLEAEKARA